MSKNCQGCHVLNGASRSPVSVATTPIETTLNIIPLCEISFGIRNPNFSKHSSAEKKGTDT